MTTMTQEEFAARLRGYIKDPNTDVTGFGKNIADDFNRQISAYEGITPVQKFKAYERYKNDWQTIYKQQGYTDDQIGKIFAEADTFADPRNQEGFFDQAYGLGQQFLAGWEKAAGNFQAAFNPEWAEDNLKAAEEHRAKSGANAQIATYLQQSEQQQREQNGQSGFGATLASYWNNPRAFVGGFTEEVLPQLAMTAPAIAAAPFTGGTSLAPVAAAVLGTQGALSEAGAYRLAMKDKIEGMSQEQLMALPEMQSRMAQGMTFEQAKADFATDFSDHAVGTAAAAGIGSLESLSGIGKLGVAKGLKGAAKTFVKEPVLQGGQEGLAQINQNLGAMQIDPNHTLTEGVGSSVATGGMFGVPTGAVSALSQLRSPDESENPAQQSKKVADEIAYPDQVQGATSAEKSAKSTNIVDEKTDDHTNPEIERVLDLRKRMTEWRSGKKVGDISDLLDTPMSFADQDAKRDFALESGFSEVKAIAEKHGVDPNDGKAMYRWLEDYVAKRDQAKANAKTSREENYRAKYDDFLGLSTPQSDVVVQGASSEPKSAKNPDATGAVSEADSATVEPITPEKVVSDEQNKADDLDPVEYEDLSHLPNFEHNHERIWKGKKNGNPFRSEQEAEMSEVFKKAEEYRLNPSVVNKDGAFLVEVDKYDDNIKLSRSAMKSVEANIARGRQAMTKAILEKNSVHRAMYNHELGGWVDFEWGDDGTTQPPNKKGEPVGKGIAHIIEARMRKDGMSYQDVTRMLTNEIVETIAKGQVVHQKRNDKHKETRLTIDFNQHRAALLKRDGSNSWIITGFEKFPVGELKAGNDAVKPTHLEPTLTRHEMGATGANNVQQSTSQSNTDPEIKQAKTLLREVIGDALVEQIQFTTSQHIADPNPKRQADKRSSEGFVEKGKLTLVVDNITAGKVLNRSQRLAWVTWHELAHAGIEVKYGNAFQTTLNFARSNPVVSVIGNRIAKAYAQDGITLTENQATEEAIVELYAAAQTENWAEIEQRYGVKIHHSWKRGEKSVMNHLARIAYRLRNFIRTITGAEAKTASDQDVLNVLRQVKRSVRELGENAQSSKANEDVRYSLNENTDSEFAKAVDEVFNSQDDRFDNSRWIDLGTTPDALIQSGIDDKVMKINFAKIGKIKKDHPEMTADLLKQIPRELNNPVAVFKNTRGKPNSYVVLTELTVKGNERVIAALHADQEVGGLVFHKLASAYGKDGTRAYLENMIEKSDVRFVDKQKASRINSKLQLLAEDTIDLLFDKASVVKDDGNVNEDETLSDDGDVRYSRKQSALDLSQTGKAKAEPSIFDTAKRGELRKVVDKVFGKLDEWIADGLRPVNDWISQDLVEGGITAHEAARLRDDMYRAKGVRDALKADLEQKYLKPLLQKVASLSKSLQKKDKRYDELSVKRLVGIWASVRYSIERNQRYLDREYQAMLDAETELNKAKASSNLDELSQAEAVYRAAEKQYRYRKQDVESTDFSKDRHYKVGTAGGWSIPLARQIMANIEQHIDRAELEAIANILYDLNKSRLDIDLASGRYTQQQYDEYKQDRHYVPLTGDPKADEGFDFIAGTGSNAVNIGKDKAADGRTSSEAEDAIDAVWQAIGKTTTFAGWADFKNAIDHIYESEVARLQGAGLSAKSAKEQVEKTLGISKQKMQGLTRSSDDVLIRKEGGSYYEYRIPAKAMEALKNDNVENANAFLKVLSKPTGWYARGVTQWTLTFAPMNMMRDTWEKSEFIRVQTLYDAHGNPIDDKTMDKIGRGVLKQAVSKETWQAVKRFGLGQELRDNMPSEKALKTLLKNGGISTYSTYLARTEMDLIRNLKAQNRPMGKLLEKAGSALESYNKVFDTVSALAAYKSLIENGIDEKQAAATTLELTNFRKTGSKMRGIKALYMFSQPTAMGARNLIKYLSTAKGQKRFVGYMAVMIPLYLTLRAMDDDDEGGNIMDQLGDITRYIPIPLGDGKYFKTPVGFGMPQMAWNFSVNMVKAGVSDISISEAAVNMFTHSLKTFAPVSPSEISAAKYPLEKLTLTATPTILQPLMQNVLNRSAFGNKITTNFVRDDKLKAEQSKSTTAQFWKDVAIEMNDVLGIDMHPEQIKNLFDGYGSMLGSLKELQTIFIENPNREQLGRRTRTPFLNQFIGTTNEFAIQSRYYEASEEAQDFAKRYQSQKERGNAPGLSQQERAVLAFHQMNSTRMGKLRSEKAKLTKALREGKMSPNLYEAKLKAYNQEVDKVQRFFLKRWREIQGLNTH